jgi:ribosomal protein S18 acetylase RimI-like enzyme
VAAPQRDPATMAALEALSIGWRTHLMFARFDGEVVARGDHIVVRTPHNPTYWWGNFLLYENAPREGDAAAWLAAFDEDIARHQPDSTHRAFGIDGPADFALPADFVEAGFTKSLGTVLTLKPDWLDPTPRTLPGEFSIRAAELPARIPALVDLQVAANDSGHPTDSYRLFRQRQMQRYAAMQDAGLGHWFAVYARGPQGEIPVADCGLFRERRGAGGTARFQNVCTHPQWRRRGLASALVYAVCRHAFQVMRDETLVIVADPDDVAIGLYQSLGFERLRDLAMLSRRPPRPQPATTSTATPAPS